MVNDRTVYDVVVIGAGPAGTQAAVSASHQLRHVLVIDAGRVSQRKGRAYWSKSVEIEDAPTFAGITGPRFVRRLHEWLEARSVNEYVVGGERRLAGVEVRGGVVLQVFRTRDELFELAVSVGPLTAGTPEDVERFFGRTLIVASGFEDRWPDIDVDKSAERMYAKYRTVFQYAGNARGWHVCIRCDGHLHVNQHLALVGCGDYIYDSALGAQDFTNKITILTNGRPHGMSDPVFAQVRERNIDIIETRIRRHIGKGTDLLGLELEDGRELFFDGFLVDEGLEPNTAFLDEWDLDRGPEGLLRVNDDNQVLDGQGQPVTGLYAAGDVVSGERKLIAAALAMGQNAALSACDSLRSWPAP